MIAGKVTLRVLEGREDDTYTVQYFEPGSFLGRVSGEWLTLKSSAADLHAALWYPLIIAAVQRAKQQFIFLTQEKSRCSLDCVRYN